MSQWPHFEDYNPVQTSPVTEVSSLISLQMFFPLVILLEIWVTLLDTELLGGI